MKIAVIGCGNMGMAYTHSFVKQGIATKESLLLIEKMAEKKIELERLDIAKVIGSISAEIADYRYIILAVKPQDFEATAAEIRKYVTTEHVFISIMAGVTIQKIKTLLNTSNAVRAMPNTPAQINMGVTAYAHTEEINDKQLKEVETILSSTGKVVYLPNENLLDAVTAISGSGPAYYFYYVKHMIEAGIKLGMTEEMAATLVKQTMIGSYHLIMDSPKTLDELIASVKSKGGTTEAALDHFEDSLVGKSIIDALGKAEQRAKELSK
jgi:pyrroline-5-carboxylate reductase